MYQKIVDMNEILRKSDVESSRQDQTQLDSTSEGKKKMSQSQAMVNGVCFTCDSKGHTSGL